MFPNSPKSKLFVPARQSSTIWYPAATAAQHRMTNSIQYSLLRYQWLSIILASSWNTGRVCCRDALASYLSAITLFPLRLSGRFHDRQIQFRQHKNKENSVGNIFHLPPCPAPESMVGLPPPDGPVDKNKMCFFCLIFRQLKARRSSYWPPFRGTYQPAQ